EQKGLDEGTRSDEIPAFRPYILWRREIPAATNRREMWNAGRASVCFYLGPANTPETAKRWDAMESADVTATPRGSTSWPLPLLSREPIRCRPLALDTPRTLARRGMTRTRTPSDRARGRSTRRGSFELGAPARSLWSCRPRR